MMPFCVSQSSSASNRNTLPMAAHRCTPSSEGMLRRNLKSERFLYYTEEERPIAAQIFGADPAHLAEAARMIEDLGFDMVDLNLGCPAKKVVKCGGSGLLRDLPLLARIFRER